MADIKTVFKSFRDGADYALNPLYIEREKWTLNLDFTSGSLDRRIQFTRNSIATRFDRSGKIVTVAAGVFRANENQDYDPVTHEPLGALIEEARTNLVLHSQDFTAGVWDAVKGASVSSGIDSPDGANNACRIAMGAGLGAYGGILQEIVSPIPSNEMLAESVWLRGSGTVHIDTNEYPIGHKKITLTPEWTRYSLTGSNAVASVEMQFRLLSYPGDTAASVDIFGAQLERGTFPTSYIPTTTTAVTRSSDIATIGVSWFDRDAFALYVDYSKEGDLSVFDAAIDISVGGGSSDELYTTVLGGAGNRRLWWFDTGDGANIGKILVADGFVKTAISCGSAEHRACANGSTVIQVAGNVFSGATAMGIGNRNGHVAGRFHIKRIKYFPAALSDAQLQALTTGADLGTDQIPVGIELADDDGLETAVIMSLFTDRRAADDDALPFIDADRRGWWGDSYPDVPNDRIGSRLWLLARSKQTQAVLNRAREYAQEALAWLVDDGVASSVTVDAEIVRTGVLGLSIAIQRPRAAVARYRFEKFWTETA